MKHAIKIALALGIAVFTINVSAHHSFSATFTDEEITVEGYVARMSFTNPHVMIYFNVTDANGETVEWASEGAAATLMRGRGWDRESLKEGDYVRITGNSTRNGSPMVSTESINFVDPATGEVVGTPGGEVAADPDAVFIAAMERDDGLPNLTGAWARVNAQQGGGMGAAGMGERGGMGARGGMGGGNNTMPYNEVGAALQAVFDPINDPQVQCEPPGLVRQAGSTPHPVNIEQHADHVVISYEEYGSVRSVYFDDRDLVGGEHSHLGQSKARYEDQKLIIETTHLNANLTNPGGNGLSDQTTTVETYYRNQDSGGQSSLTMDMVITDPGHLTEPWTRSWTKFYNSNYDFIEVDCQKPYGE